jgi:LysM repeat protein
MAQRAHSRTSGSGRGRHRKPSTHTRNLGLATASIVGAIPLATSAPASAASSSWDRLAGCESGQNWSINTGNGYYGGLQFADATWDGWGGEKYASRADLATKAEQIVIAAKLVENSGWRSWPGCSSKLGLDGADRREALATAEEYRARMNGSQSNGAATKSDGAKSDGAKSEGAKNDGAKSDGTAAEKRAKDNRVSPERASRGKHRKEKAATRAYVVRRGDTLSAIARKRDIPGGWQALYRINRSTIGKNPGLIYPGQRLRVR